MKILKMILSPITGPIKLILTVGLLIAGVVFTYQQNWWSFIDLLPGWEPYAETEYHHIPDSVIVGAIWQNDGVLIGASCEVFATDSLYVERSEGYMDNELDFEEVRDYGARATLAVHAQDAEVLQDANTIRFVFREPYIFSVEMMPDQEKLLHQNMAAAWMPNGAIPAYEKYRQKMRERTRIKMFELNQYTEEKRRLLFSTSKKTLEATIRELLGDLESNRQIVVEIL